MRFKIVVRTLQGTIITFHVSHYDLVEGFVSFIDEKTGEARKFHGANCEIREVLE